GLTRCYRNRTTVAYSSNLPTVTAPTNQSAVEGAAAVSINLGSFSDSSAGSWLITVTWGDGSAVMNFTMSSPGTITAQAHSYSEENGRASCSEVMKKKKKH